MEKYIRLYHNVISGEECDNLVDYYNKNIGNSQDFDFDWRRCNCITLYQKENDQTLSKVKDYIKNAFEKYKSDVSGIGGTGTLYFCNTLEVPNMLCYKHNSDQPHKFNTHSDAWSVESSTRQISVIIYLNDVEDGGETKFVYNNITIKPKKGTILMFPSNFCYMHEGCKPVSEDKYIIVSWIHFDGMISYTSVSMK